MRDLRSARARWTSGKQKSARPRRARPAGAGTRGGRVRRQTAVRPRWSRWTRWRPAVPAKIAAWPSELRRQQEQAQRLLEQLEAVSGQAEASAPLLSRKLYDGLREAKLSDLENTLGTAGELLDRNLADEGRAAEQPRARAVAG